MINIKGNKSEYDSYTYLPWKLFCFYIIITLFINFFGPWEYDNYNKLLSLFYIVIFLVFATLTYSSSINAKVYNKHIKIRNKFYINSNTITKVSLIFSFILYLLLFISKIKENSFSFSSITNTPLSQIMAQSYVDTRSSTYKFNIFVWINSYFYMFVIIALVLGAYKFKQLSLKYKLLTIGIYVLFFTYTIFFLGAQKAIGDIIIYWVSVLLIKHCKFKKKIKIRKGIIFVGIILCVILLFSSTLVNRTEIWNTTLYSIDNLAHVNYDNWMIRLLPNSIKAGIAALLIYPTSGYYGLSLCLQQPFQWSMGFGSSFAIKDILTRVLGIDNHNLPLPYPERMEQATGWSAYSNWHTIFPWLASDFTFIGAIIFVCIIVYLYATTWKKCLSSDNWISIVLFAHLNIFLIYVPANNQLFQTKTSLIATLVLFIIWCVWRNVNEESEENQLNLKIESRYIKGVKFNAPK